jgi:hypothetical protein
MVDLEELSAALDYDPISGIFTWKTKRSPKNEIGGIAGRLDSGGYVQLTFNYRRIYAHRVAFLFMMKRWPNGPIDHINGNRSDNSWDNLRESSTRENGINRKEHRRGQLPGAVQNNATGKYYPKIWVGKKRVSLGVFDTAEQAHNAYMRAYHKCIKTKE